MTDERRRSPVVVAAVVGFLVSPVGWLLLSLFYGFSGVDLVARIATLAGTAAIIGPAVAHSVNPPSGPAQGRWWVRVVAAALAGAAASLLIGIGVAELL
jgi:hypothetical protein